MSKELEQKPGQSELVIRYLNAHTKFHLHVLGAKDLIVIVMEANKVITKERKMKIACDRMKLVLMDISNFKRTFMR